MFIDKIKIYVKAGNGGNGCVSFRREKYVAKGGPDGGDGGRGGNIVFRIDEGSNTLLAFRYKRKFAAENGADGAGGKMHGKNGGDVVIKVPAGTVIRDAESGAIIKDMSGDGDFILCRGGKGGFGNRHFATPTRQVPNFAKNGLPGEEREIVLELKMIADVGLVGLPSAGKSSLLAAVSGARPKIAEYHFTTLEPSLGVVSTGDDRGFVMADIPGLIEGASEGAGLGHEFLRHVDRCRMLIQVVDAASTEGRDPLDDFITIDGELKNFDEDLASRPRLIAANKCDMIADRASPELKRFEEEMARRGYEVIYISAATTENTRALVLKAEEMLSHLPPVKVFEAEEIILDDIENSGPDAVIIKRDDDGAYNVSGKWIELLCGRINFSDRESLMYFENQLVRYGVIDRLRDAGCEEGDTVRMFEFEFDFID
ncbi:MAG: GTPase ObgE [Clostridia bacterium]|nr:GTPase ObgE [Clostridia bacterium]